jgi:2'-5' RNA ligase
MRRAGGRGGGGGGSRPNHFVSVKLTDAALVDALVAAQGRLRDTGVQLEATPSSKFHFTLALLKFDYGEEESRRVAAALAKHLRRQWTFPLSLGGVGSFGSGVAFARATEGEERLRELQRLVQGALRSECAELEHREDRAWQPHCTLFKGKGRTELAPLLQREAGTHFGAQSIAAVSVCRMGGAAADGGYVTLAQVPLLRTLAFAEVADKGTLLSACYALETQSYPPDEAASLERMQMRSERAGELFCVLLRGEEVVGFVNATACSGEMTEQTMAAHDPAGLRVCIHSVVIAPAERKQGLGGALFWEYMHLLVSLNRFESAHLLCKPELVSFYARHGGFVCDGPSKVVHGSTPWVDCSFRFK